MMVKEIYQQLLLSIRFGDVTTMDVCRRCSSLKRKIQLISIVV